ncbi:MAG: DUF3015 domain-containing protein [Rhodospirillales bacterium]|nr:DUF3015 domain-containing protein [Rhodospirillales bacterium]
MKKVAVCVLAFGLISSGEALAQGKGSPNNVGCGLGSQVWEGSKGVFPQVFAATTNGTFGTQTFGISSETSGCARNGVVRQPDKMAMFIAPNMNRLVQDMSRGDGETLASLADVIGIDATDRPVFFAATQSNFTRIMPNESVTADEMAASIQSVMRGDKVLKRYVMS